MNKFYIHTLGCRLNQAESQELARKLLAAGWRKVESPKKADLLVLNTCVVTQKAEKETRQAIRRLRRENSKARLVVAGCWVNKIRRFGGKKPDGIDYLLGNQEKWDKFKLIVNNEKLKVELKINSLLNGRGLVWVQKGCSNQCAYCLTRLVRGASKNRPVGQIIEAVKQALAAGVKEIVLTGQNISQYWHQGKNWIDLVGQVLEKTDTRFLRLGSVNPVFDPQKFVDVYQKRGKGRLARHLHLSLQSGSDRILKLMGRNYTTKQFAGVVNILRRGVPGINITTDIIVGFPGENEKDFQKTLDFVQKMRFGKIHIFRYSSRKGTLAAKMEQEWGRVDEKNKKARAQQLSRLERKLRYQFWRGQIGKKAMAIVWRNGRGLSDNYIPIVSRRSRVCRRPVLAKGKFVEIANGLVYFHS